MSMIKWDPFKNIVTLQGRINRLFEDAFPRSADDEQVCAWRPLVDIYETDEGVVLQMDLPGVKKEDVSIEIKNNLLTIHGQRPVQNEIRQDFYYQRERICGTFQRSFSLHAATEPDQINASFKNGVLTVRIPYPKEDKPQKVSVSID
jgi:HSP20 family protein